MNVAISTRCVDRELFLLVHSMFSLHFRSRLHNTPDALFEGVCELSGISETCPNVSAGFISRSNTGRAAREKKAKHRPGSHEVRIADIYSEFPFKLFDRSRSVLTDLMDTGFRANSSCVAPIPDIVQKHPEMKHAQDHHPPDSDGAPAARTRPAAQDS